jgi:hypothetical protein
MATNSGDEVAALDRGGQKPATQRETMKLWVAALALLSTGAMPIAARADDCKPVAEALARTATVPNHTLVISQSLGKIETVHTQNAYYESFQGVWKQLPYDDSEQAARKIAAFQGKKADCALRGTETIGDRAVQHYTATEHLRNGDVSEEYWITSEGGQLLKSTTKLPRDDVTTTYDYADIKAPM